MIHAIYILLIFLAYFLGLGTIYYSRSQRRYRRIRREFQHSLDTIGWDCGTNTARQPNYWNQFAEANKINVVDEAPDDNI